MRIVFAQSLRWKVAIGLLGALLGFPVWFAFCLGFAVRACLVADPASLGVVALQMFLSFLGAFAICIAALIAGFAIGYLAGLKPLLVSVLLLTIAAFASGCAIGAGGCEVFW